MDSEGCRSVAYLPTSYTVLVMSLPTPQSGCAGLVAGLHDAGCAGSADAVHGAPRPPGHTVRRGLHPHPLCVPARCAFWCSQYAHTTGACTARVASLQADASRRILQAAAATKRCCQLARRTPCGSGQGFRLGLIGKNHCESPKNTRLCRGVNRSAQLLQASPHVSR